ncbi:MAG: efflux RND transporter permease subunit [Devosia sp.]|nr:efflux RND transporter permease subunit [Devosia sp.]
MRDFIERMLRMPRAVLTIMVILLIGGGFAYVTLPKESFPAIDIPYFYVATSDTGVSPGDVDRLITKPILDKLKDLDHLDHIDSTSTLGYSAVVVQLDVNADKTKGEQDIRAKLDGIAADLPSDATTTTITAISLSNSINVAVYGNVPERTLVQHAKDLKTALEAIPDVQSVDISGERDEIMQVTVDSSKLDAYGLTASQLLDALAKNNIIVPGGTINTGNGSFNVQVPGVITNPADVFTLPIKTDGNTVVTFGDVGKVTRTFADATSYAHVDGRPAITLAVSKKIGTNVIGVSDAVRKTTDDLAKTWPPGIDHSFLVDQADSTKSLYKSLEAAVLTAVALVMITCVATLGIRPALMIGTSIPISFMIAFLVVQMLGMTINMMIMFGLVLAVGVLVDDPIVVVEYAERKIAEGVPKREAFIQAARKMFVPVVSATFTTLGAFIPLLFWPGIIGKFMSYLPVIVIVVMCASLLSALIFMPVIGGIIARTHINEEEKEAADVVMYPDKFDVRKVRGFSGAYVRFLAHLLHWPLPTLAVGFGIVVAIFMFAHPPGFVAFPPQEAEFGTVNVIANGNFSPEQERDLLVKVENQVLQVRGIQDSVMTFTGKTSGFGSSAAPPNTIGQLSLQLLPWNDRVKAETIFQDIRDRVKGIAGIDVEVAAQENGPPAGKDINLRVQSSNYDDLVPAVGKLRDYIQNQLGDTADIEDGRPAPGIDWQVTVDRVEAAKYGIGVRELSPYVQLITQGVKLGTYRPNDATDELDIRARLPENERSFASLDNLRIATSQGLIPVSNFIKRTAIPKVAKINRYNDDFSMTVAANITQSAKTADGAIVAKKIAELKKWQAGEKWPSDVQIVYSGSAQQQDDTFAFLGKAGAAVIFIIFLVLLLEYNSFYQVFVTLSTVAMSIAGVMLGLHVLNMTFSAIMTGLGIVALAGIVVKNGIVLIDTYNHYRRDDHVEPVKAMLITAAQRVRPVLLTATVTALGVIPMALNVEFDFIRREITSGGLAGMWFVHLSTALVSGLFVSTALTLIMVPVMITAPDVIWGQLKGIGSFFGRLFGRRTDVQPVPAGGLAAEIPALDSAKRYMTGDGKSLVETERDGVTIVSRQAAE